MTQEIPNLAMKGIKVKVQEAHVGSDICIAPNISSVGVKSTLSRVRQGHFSEAIIVNISEPEELPVVHVSSVGSQKKDSLSRQSSSLESYIKIVHFV